MNLPRIGILIPFKTINIFVFESVKKCLKLNYSNFYIILLPDEKIQLPFRGSKIRIVPTGTVSAAAKRNIGLLYCKKNTELVAFIDSDAYPDINWLKNAVKYFQDKLVMAVGGPNISPSGQSYARKITGLVYEQEAGFGDGAFRHKLSKTRWVGELPTCNLIVRKKLFVSVHFDEGFLAAEDNMLCHQIIKRGYKILFAEDVLVMHHRRKIFLPMMKQAYYYGYFRAKLLQCTNHYPVKVFFPSLLLIYFTGIIALIFFNTGYGLTCSLPAGVYLLTILTSNIWYIRNPVTALVTTFAILLCHLSYGSGFLNYFYHSLRNYFHLNVNYSPGRQKLNIPVNE